MTIIRRVAWAATVVTYFLIALGGTVLATDSGLSCPDWPFCYGQAYYSGTYHVFLEQFHRFTAAAISILIVLLLIGIIKWARKDRALLTMAIAAPILLAIQIVLGGLTVLWQLPPQVITAHLGTALAIFAIVITIAVLSGKNTPSKEHPANTRKFAQLAISNALLVYILMLLGSYVTGSDAALACLGWPFCTPAPGTVSNHLAAINILHRVFAVFVGLVMLWTVISALRRWRVARGQAIVALVGGVLFVCQAIVGGLIVLLKEPAFVAGLHLALATAVWGTLVLLAALASNQLRAAPQQQEIEEMEQAEAEEKKETGLVRQTIANYIDLMKPHVTVLLLGVTAAAMSIANQGLPPLALVIPTLLGGAMAAGSANCINCYIDRDHSLLRFRVHARSQAHLDAEYRYRRRRGGRTGARRLGSHHEQLEPARYLALRHHLLLDASALLGLMSADPERLRKGGHPHAAHRQGRGGDTAANTALLAARAGCHPRALRHGRHGLLLPGRSLDPGRWAGLPRHPPVARSIQEVGAHAFLVLEHVPGRHLRHHGAGPRDTLA